MGLLHYILISLESFVLYSFFVIPPGSYSRWLPRSRSFTTPCTATSRRWPMLSWRVSRRLVVTPSSSKSPRPSPKTSLTRCTHPPRTPQSPPSTTPPSSKNSTVSSSVSQPATATSPHNSRPSGTRPASNGNKALSGVNTPVSSCQPVPSVAARRLPPSLP